MTLVLVFGGTIAVADAIVRRQQGSLVTGLAFGEVLRGLRADAFEALQVRLSPVAAHAVIDAVVADLHGVVVTLGDLCGGEAAQVSPEVA